MSRKPISSGARWMRIAVLPALALAGSWPAQTQAQTQPAPGSVENFRLPPAAPAPAPAPAGPVDSENPSTAPTRPAPTPEPTPAATPPPVIALPSPPTSAARQVAPAVRAAQPPAATAPAFPAPATAPDAAPTISPVVEATPPPPVPLTPVLTDPARSWPWYAGGAALALALAGAFLWRRRSRDRGAEYEDEAAEPVTEPLPESSARAALSPLPLPSASPQPHPKPPIPTPDGGAIEMRFEARHLSRAMVNATLAYRLTLTNHTGTTLGPLRVAGDIISAHASLSARDQLTPPDDRLAAIHAVDSLAPGESALLSGELRLPLASILPIHSGAARVFVPLARFRAEADGSASVTRIFVVGQESEPPGGALRPFPLDRGPGIDRALGQRELGLPA